MGGSLVVLGLNVGGCSAGTAYPMGAFVVLAALGGLPGGGTAFFSVRKRWKERAGGGFPGAPSKYAPTG